MTTATEHSSTPEEQASAFADGFNGDNSPAEVVAEHATPTDVVIDETPVVEAAQAVATPEFAAITADQWASVQASLAELDNLKKGTRAEFDKLGGKFGEVNRVMQQQRPGGMRISKEAMADLESEYPELGAKLKAIFTDAGDAPAAGSAVSADEFERRVQERLQPERARLDKLASQQIDFGMQLHHKDWRQVVASPDFETWRKSLPEDEARQTVESDDVGFAAGQIDKFKAHRQELADRAEAEAARTTRQQNGAKRLEAAITPQGTAKTGAPQKTLHDHFKDGFQS